MTDMPMEADESRLAEFPVSFFAIVMGLAGLTLATRAVEHALQLGPVASPWALLVTVVVFGLIALVYMAKAALHPDALVAEWRHPVRIAFFPAISISVLLIATAAAPLYPTQAEALWLVGLVAQGGLTLAVVASWIGHRPFQHLHLSPAWFIPAVGNVLAPVAGAGFGYAELSWLFFSVGLVFWIVLLTLVFNRLVFHDPLPDRLTPTLVILIAPPAVAFIAYMRLGGDIDPFARILLNAGYLFLGVVATQASKIAKLPFALSFWALSFPIAALSIASLIYAERIGSRVHEAIGLGLWALLAAAVLGLILRTLMAIYRREICRPE